MALELAAAFLLLVLMTHSAARGEPPVPGKQVAAVASTKVDTDWEYWVYLPKDYATEEQLPLMLFLHGAGERGPDLEKVKVHGPPKLAAQGKQFPFILVAPQCKPGRWWDATELSGLLDTIESQYKVDKSRIYLSGLSMGGFGVWALAMREPERFAAIAPVCGGGNAVEARYVKPMRAPAWVFHGAKDTVVPLQKSQEMVDVLKAAKVEVKFTVYPDAGHDSWTETYNNPELYRWLLSHSRANGR